MAKQNCWEFKKCGRQPGGENVSKDGVCPAAAFELADGFCEGKNGGRACSYIIGTLCSKDVCAIDDMVAKQRICSECDFYKKVKSEDGNRMSMMAFRDFIDDKKSSKK